MKDNVVNARIYLQAGLMANQLPKLNGKARIIFNKAKAQILDEFDAHPITRAIDNHSWYEGIPDNGTLFGFLGFHAGDNPTENIREILYHDFNFIGVTQKGPQTVYISFSVPANTDIFDATPLEWADGRSWTEAIESGGVAGVGLYLGEMDKGRSEEGVQAKGKIGGRSGKFGPHKYISDFLKKSESKIRKQINEELILT